jgi:hypothetical protein
MDKKTLPIESVSKMLGHGRIATKQHYAWIVDKKIEEDMRVLQVKSWFSYFKWPNNSQLPDRETIFHLNVPSHKRFS